MPVVANVPSTFPFPLNPTLVTTSYDMPVGEGVYYPREQQVGLVYETYAFVPNSSARPGVSILLQDGRDIGGLSAEEADQLLVPLGPTGLHYQFTNKTQLHHDYSIGLFEEALHHAYVQQVAQAARIIYDADPTRRPPFLPFGCLSYRYIE